MIERPIIFSGEMVRAILEGRKTQTRRTIPNKLQLCLSPEDEPDKFIEWCKYGQPGDRLWVREKWRIVGWQEGEPLVIEFSDGKIIDDRVGEFDSFNEERYTQYLIDCSNDCIKAGIKPDIEGIFSFGGNDNVPTRWRPSIFMPRWASRITLEIKTIRVERVQGISEEDAIAEGAPGIATHVNYPRKHRDSFEVVWNTINAKRGYGWDSNPWVWVIEFERN